MNSEELCKWLRESSSGVCQPAAEAADLIESQQRQIAGLLEALDSITVANRICIQQESREPVRRDDGSLHEYTIKLPGGPYSCECGCNVFHHPDRNDLSLYKCNGCKSEFHST